MANEPDDLAASSDWPETDLAKNDEPEMAWPEIVRRVRARTPARLLAGRAGAAYRTQTRKLPRGTVPAHLTPQ